MGRAGHGAGRRVLAVAVGTLALAAGAYIGFFRGASDRPEAPPPSAAPASDTPAVSDIEALSRRLEQEVPEAPVLAPPEPSRPPALPGGVVELPGTSVVHDELSAALEHVNALLAEGRNDVALARAAALTAAHPNALPAWAALAQAEENTRNLPGAQDAWREILLRTDSGPWYDRATREISRLTSRQMNFSPPPVPMTQVELPEAPPIPPDELAGLAEEGFVGPEVDAREVLEYLAPFVEPAQVAEFSFRHGIAPEAFRGEVDNGDIEAVMEREIVEELRNNPRSDGPGDLPESAVLTLRPGFASSWVTRGLG